MTRKHFLPLTYEPKIRKVMNGECTQTIRAGRRFNVGDLIAFHGWEGYPYRSGWTYLMTYRVVFWVNDIHIWRSKFVMVSSGYPLYFTDNPITNEIAARDGIDPPTGEELGNVLNRMHKIGPEGIQGQIIRWRFS